MNGLLGSAAPYTMYADAPDAPCSTCLNAESDRNDAQDARDPEPSADLVAPLFKDQLNTPKIVTGEARLVMWSLRGGVHGD